MHVHGSLATLSRSATQRARNACGSHVHDEHCTLSLYQREKGKEDDYDDMMMMVLVFLFNKIIIIITTKSNNNIKKKNVICITIYNCNITTVKLVLKKECTSISIMRGIVLLFTYYGRTKNEEESLRRCNRPYTMNCMMNLERGMMLLLATRGQKKNLYIFSHFC